MELFISLIVIAILILVSSYFYLVPKEDTIDTNQFPKSFIIKTINRFEIQNDNFECAAFSSAYILRHFGVEADGNNLYKNYPRKIFNGLIVPKGVVIFFRRRGYKAVFYKGSIAALKKQISNGIPIIVFMKVFCNQGYLHFAVVVGYDEEYLYLADSLKYTINSDEKNYNRKIPIREFEVLWKTWLPFYKNTYIAVGK